MKKFNFQKDCIAMLTGIGATSANDYGSYNLQLDTIAGRMRCIAYDDWLACRFDDVAAAKKLIGNGCLNPFSGKWNWHYDQPTQFDLDDLRVTLQSILIRDPALQ